MAACRPMNVSGIVSQLLRAADKSSRLVTDKVHAANHNLIWVEILPYNMTQQTITTIKLIYLISSSSVWYYCIPDNHITQYVDVTCALVTYRTAAFPCCWRLMQGTSQCAASCFNPSQTSRSARKARLVVHVPYQPH